MIRLAKGISSGTTAILHLGDLPEESQRAQILDPVRGIGADLLVTISDSVRTYTRTEEISPPSAAIRLAAALVQKSDGQGERIDLFVEGRPVEVSLDAGELAINHGAWAICGGAEAIAAGHDRTLEIAGLAGTRPGLGVTVGERTIAVVALASAEELGALDLLTPPTQSHPTDLVCALTILGERIVELTDATGAVVGTEAIGAVQVRGYDARVGEVFSADAIAVAAAAAARAWLGEDSAREWIVVFSAGTTRVVLGEEAITSAQAELFAEIVFTPEG